MLLVYALKKTSTFNTYYFYLYISALATRGPASFHIPAPQRGPCDTTPVPRSGLPGPKLQARALALSWQRVPQRSQHLLREQAPERA